MYILPAIDLIDGKCVRLVQGEYHRKITYKDDPLEQAREFIDAGAQWLHIIDLDGAKVGKPVNTESIKAIAALGKLKIEVGGGIRDENAIEELLACGIERLIVGTKAIKEFGWFVEMTHKFPGKLVLGLDARGSKVATHGWTEEAPETLIEFAQKADELPLGAIIYTDISKDGMLDGPNIDRTPSLVEAVQVPIVAAGGVSSVDDIVNLRKIGVAGAVIGRALYEGTLDLVSALKAVC